MQEPEKLNSAGDEMVEALRRLRPAAGNRSARDVWYEAGYQSGRRSLNVWRATAAVLLIGMTGVTVWDHRWGSQGGVSGSGWAVERAPARAAPVVASAETQRDLTGPAVIAADWSYARLRDSLIRDGVRGLAVREMPGGNPSEPPVRRHSREVEIESVYPTNVRGL